MDIQCDQHIPTCSQCAKRGRLCTYRSAGVLSRTHDSSELIRFAPSGGGVFYAFASRRSSMPLKVPSNAEDLLIARFTSMNNELSGEWTWFDRFLSDVTIRIGPDPMLNQAIAFTCASYAAFRHQWDTAYDFAAQKAGARALVTLREGIESRHDDRNNVATIAGLLCVGEVGESSLGHCEFGNDVVAAAQKFRWHMELLRPSPSMCKTPGHEIGTWICICSGGQHDLHGLDRGGMLLEECLHFSS